MSIRSIASVVAALALCAAPARADVTIDYKLTGTADGSLGSTTFTSADFTLTASGQESQIMPTATGLGIPLSNVAIDVAGMGSATVSSALELADTPSGIISWLMRGIR